MAIWSDATINSFAEEAELEISSQIKCISKRIALTVYSGRSIYTLPDDVISIRRITWLGKKLEPKEFQGILQYPIVNPAGSLGGFFFSGFYSLGFYVGGSSSTPQGPPYMYFYSGYGENLIKLFPTPDQNILPTGSENLLGPDIISQCIVEYYCFADVSANTYRLPAYYARRIIKSYVLWKCFSIEGSGQDLNAANYFRQKYLMLLEDCKKIHNSLFMSKINTRSPQGNIFPTKISRPRLPTNYGTIVE